MKRQALRPYHDALILLLLAVVCFLLFFYRLGAIGWLGPDEPRYAAVAREMYLTGDYITPRLHGVPWFEKPVLMYWGAALGYAIFGIGEFGARFPSAFSAALCVFLVYICARRLWNRTVGIFAALILASSLGFFAFARAASMDMPLTACLTVALTCFMIGQNDKGPHRRWWFYAFYAAVGLGVLAKGPVALVLPAASLLGFLVLRGRAGEWRTWYPKGILITIGIVAPWYVAITWANGWEFIQVFIINHNLQRFTSTVHGHDRPFYFYLPVLLMLTFPWTFLVIPALKRHFERNEHLLVWWTVVPIVFFSLSGSKLPGYILPVVPSIALLCARGLWQPSPRALRTAIFIEAGVMLFIGVAFGFFGDTLNVDPHVDGRLIAAVSFVLAGGLGAMSFWPRPGFLAAFNIAAITALVLIATSFIFPRFDQTDTMRPWDTALSGIVSKDETVFMYKPGRWAEYGLQFYRYNNARGLFSPEEVVSEIERSARILCLAEEETLDELIHLDNLEVEIVQTIGNQTAFWVWLDE